MQQLYQHINYVPLTFGRLLPKESKNVQQRVALMFGGLGILYKTNQPFVLLTLKVPLLYISESYNPMIFY